MGNQSGDQYGFLWVLINRMSLELVGTTGSLDFPKTELQKPSTESVECL